MKTSFYAGLLFCGLVVVNIALWISASIKEASFDQAKALYLGYFPVFLRNTTVLTLLGIALNSLSVYLLVRLQKLPGTGYRRVSQLLTVLNIVLISWQVFTLL